jgi:acetyl/propionyl-CoA carboxylase alpha subunit
MNTRLQVEHPVTEEVVGVDLVRAQIEVAQGRPLPWTQEQLHQRGWAMEFRIYAEDPWKNFAPSLGRILRLRTPQGAGVRNDLGVREGYEVPIFYDPMLAKLVVKAEDRPACLARARRALDEYRLMGFVHNVALHRWVVQEDEFVSGHYSTRLLDEKFDPSELANFVSDEELELMASALALIEAGVGGASTAGGSRPDELSPWGERGRALMTRGHR